MGQGHDDLDSFTAFVINNANTPTFIIYTLNRDQASVVDMQTLLSFLPVQWYTDLRAKPHVGDQGVQWDIL